MGILEQAEQIKWQETGEQIKNIMQEIDYPNAELGFYELLRFFDITTADKLRNPETIKKVEAIFQHLKGSEDIMSAARELMSRLGNPMDLEEKLDKAYSYVYSLNLEGEIREEPREEPKEPEPQKIVIEIKTK